MKKLITQVHDLSEEKNTLYKQLQIRAFSFSLIEGNDKLTSFYTGLPYWVLFIHVFTFTVPFVQPKGRLLSPMDEFFLTLVKMRLNLMHEDLACRFQISLSSVSRIFHKWIDIMHKHLKFFDCLAIPRNCSNKHATNIQVPLSTMQVYNRLL